ncbi:MAG: Cna B-type domain-containing protein, partial [Eubacteriaceae bacterium]|nr:Cna B-type domain-containing protein [Eubacteriaceae bacterium]
AYTYTVEESTVPNGYVKTQEDNTITNTYNGTGEEDPIEITATKKWEGLPEGANGATVSLQLIQNDENYGDAVQVEDSGEHEVTYTWNNLPKYAPDGTAYTYTVEESTVPNGYVKAQEGNTITNTYNGTGEEEPVEITATKKWEGLPEGANGAAVSLQLKQNDADFGEAVQVEDSGSHEASHTWNDLPKYAPDGTAYTYTVDEPVVPEGYEKTQEGNTITNTYQVVPVDPEEPEDPTTSLTATKKWVGLPKGHRGTKVVFQLHQNGETFETPVELTDDGSHTATHTWDRLPQFAPDGSKYTYTVDEPTVPKGYIKSQEGNTITNTYQKKGFRKLPFTGMQATAWMLVGSVSLLGYGLVTWRRKKS